MNGLQDTFALMGCGVALLIAWHVMREAKGPRGLSPLSRVLVTLSVAKDSLDRCNLAFARSAAAVMFAGRRRR